MTEIDVTLTDYALSVLCGWWGWRLRQHSRVWFVFFVSIGVASFAGGTVHGFFTDELGWAHRVLWPLTMLSIGITASCAWILGGHFLWPDSSQKKWTYFAGTLFLLYALAVLFYSQNFTLAILNYLPAMIFMMLAAGVRYWRHRQADFLWVIAGLGTGFLAAAAQQFQVALHPTYFNHNATYHVVQGAGLWLMYKGSMLLEKNKARTNPR